MLPEQFLEPSVIFFKLGWKPDSKWTKVRFDGAVLSNLDVKRCIMKHEKLTNDDEVYDIALTNIQTGEDFRDEGFLVPRNSALVARKVPGRKETSDRIRGEPLTVEAAKSGRVENIYGGGKIIGMPMVEDDEDVAKFLVKGFPFFFTKNSDAFAEVIDTNPSYVAGIPNPAEEFSRGGFGIAGMRYAYRFDPKAKPPPGYICHRCERAGHFIRFCPTNDDPNFNYRRAKTGPGAAPINESDITLSAPSGDAGKETISILFPSTETPSAEAPLRKELFCPLCKWPFVNAVMTVCCFATFCDVCVRLSLGPRSVGKCPEWYFSHKYMAKK